jgi:glycosyltransferase involved in cell wall biosynthesis
MKKNLLFVIDSLVLAGAEKSLITLLSLLDYSKFSVDLMLFAHGEELEKLLPEEVNLLEPLEYTKFTKMDLRTAIKSSIKNWNLNMIKSRIRYSTQIRLRNYNNAQKARIYWQSVSNVIQQNPKKYDIAISYAQGVPTFYVAEKVEAEKKVAWVNVSYKLNKKETQFQKRFYNKFNKIIAVSDSASDIFLETFPSYKDKVEIIYDIINPQIINSMADQGVSYNDDFNGIRILTIGRLAYQKGYDIALEACKKLRDQGVNFRWYILGKGPLKKEIIQFLKDNNLLNYVVLLGVASNPYPYIKDCDIYVQTSRFEGFGLAIAEARILNKPVVTTRFDAVFCQMKDKMNGLVVDMNANAVFKGILTLINNKEFRDEIINYLQSEKKGNVEEIDKFYRLIG